MIFPRADCAFGSVSAMAVWRGELEVDIFLSHEGLELGGGFVVQPLELGFESPCGKVCMELFVGLDHFVSGA